MNDLLAQFDFSKLDWAELIVPAIFVFSTVGGALVKVFTKDKEGEDGETIDAEIEEFPSDAPPHRRPPEALPPVHTPMTRRPEPARRATAAPQAPPQMRPRPAQPRMPQPPVARPPHVARRVTVEAPIPRRAARDVAEALLEHARAQESDAHRAFDDAPPQRKTPGLAPQPVPQPTPFAPSRVDLENLKLDHQRLREAIVLSEVLAPPVALRDPGQGVGTI
jgi:hypothetical protein